MAPIRRVAFAHYGEPNDISGVTSWLVALARFLTDRGITVAVLLLDLSSEGTRSPLERELRTLGIEVFRSPPTGRLRSDVAATLAFLNAWRPDVFLPQCKVPHYVAAAIAGRAGLPWAFTLHSDDPDYWMVSTSLDPQHHGGRSVCVSRHIHDQLQRRTGESDALVIPCGVDLPATPTRYRSRPFQVVYSGRLWEHQKRASLVVDSLIHACRQGQGAITATVIGDGYSREACEQRVMEELIRFTGRLPGPDVQQILQNSQAILLMSDFEGLPVALLEAMAAGVVPVVRLIPSGIPEVVNHGHTGLLVSDDPRQAAVALLELAGDPVLWQRCSEASRALVKERFSSEQCHSQWLDLLQSLKLQSSPHYPIRGWQGVWVSNRLKSSYRRGMPEGLRRLRKKLSTRIALLKGRVKQWIGGRSNSSQ
jgi:glycosyltransferase involved in cell wall biosynthesis